MKKVFIISSVLLVLVLGFWAVYYFAFRNNATNPVADPKQKAIAEKENSEIVTHEGRLTVVVSDPVLGANGDGERFFYYSLRDHALKQTALDGSGSVTLFSDFPGTPTRLLWSPRFDAVLVLLEATGAAPLWHFLDLDEKRLTPLKTDMSRLSWTNLGESILYQYTDPVTKKASMNLANPDGSNWKKIIDLGEGSYFIAPVPQSSLVSFWKRPNGLETNALDTVTLTGTSQKRLFDGRFGADFLWSKNGSRLLVGSVTEKGKHEPVLGLANENGGEYRDLGVPTLLSKVVWSKDQHTLYYAQASPFPKEAILPNDYFSRAVSSKDTFWKMDILTGKRERLIPLEDIQDAVDATELFLSADETSLFFTDRVSGKLYRLSL